MNKEPICQACECPLVNDLCRQCAGTGISDNYQYARYGTYCRNCAGEGREYYCTNKRCAMVARSVTKAPTTPEAISRKPIQTLSKGEPV